MPTMTQLMTLLLLTSAALALTSATPLPTFDVWAAAHGKSYATPQERAARSAVYDANAKFIAAHNSDPGSSSMVLGATAFTDLTHAEFLAAGRQGRAPPRPTAPVAAGPGPGPSFEFANVAVPAGSVDWRSRGAVTGVKNQGTCGSCWAFSATGAIEGLHFIKTGRLVALSEQEIGECDTNRQDTSICEGGLPDDAFAWVAKHGGLTTEAAYPYTCLKNPTDCYAPNKTKCKDAARVATITGHRDVPVNNETALAQAASVQPVSVGVDATAKSWQHYRSGVYDDPACGTTIDHAVLVVGFGTEEGTGQAFWLVKNSWGAAWGDGGYIKIARGGSSAKGPNKGQGMCAIAAHPSYPTLN